MELEDTALKGVLIKTHDNTLGGVVPGHRASVKCQREAQVRRRQGGQIHNHRRPPRVVVETLGAQGWSGVGATVVPTPTSITCLHCKGQGIQELEIQAWEGGGVCDLWLLSSSTIFVSRRFSPLVNPF